MKPEFVWLTVSVAVVFGPQLAAAQQSSSYDVDEHALNQGGNPADGSAPASASYRLTLDAIGDAASGTALSSASYRMDAGFVVAYPPPEEVLGLQFVTQTVFGWQPEKSVGGYNVYRGLVSGLAGGYGTCFGADLGSASATDTGLPPAGDAYFYLVTAENRLAEEGTLGTNSGGVPRTLSAPCP